MLPNGELPRVGVVIPTHDRPELLRKALASVLAQDYAGPIEVTVVFDRAEPDESLAQSDPWRTVTVRANARTPGLAGSRNTGILALDTAVIAFCDDDDEWLPGKLAAQVGLLLAEPGAEFVTTTMRVDYGDRSTVRYAGQQSVTITELARSRMAMLHSSAFLFRREAMLGESGFGLVDETLPRSMAEDWDLLLRAARRAPIRHIDEPLIAVRWGASSYFIDVWSDKNLAHEWLVEHHPEIRADRVAMGHMLGKLAFGHAALGHRREALRHIGRAVRANWREPRTVMALLVVAGVSPGVITTALNKRGHGI
jgi:glycosyltransferase involved in cell wall biosynthesis